MMQDTNGNQIRIDYQTGQYAVGSNTSSRPAAIFDGRSEAMNTSNPVPTYAFLYSADGHLQSIGNPRNSSDWVNLAYSAPTTLTPPWTSSTSFGAAQML